MKNLLLVSALLVAAASLGACNHQKSAEEAENDIKAAEVAGAKDVADAEADALSGLAEARRDETKSQIDTVTSETDPEARRDQLASSQSRAVSELAEAQYKVTLSEIEATHRIAKERCATYTGKEKGDCLDRAKNEYDMQVAAAKTRRDSEAPQL